MGKKFSAQNKGRAAVQSKSIERVQVVAHAIAKGENRSTPEQDSRFGVAAVVKSFAERTSPFCSIEKFITHCAGHCVEESSTNHDDEEEDCGGYCQRYLLTLVLDRQAPTGGRGGALQPRGAGG
jgi:hypothetical protein